MRAGRRLAMCTTLLDEGVQTLPAVQGSLRRPRRRFDVISGTEFIAGHGNRSKRRAVQAIDSADDEVHFPLYLAFKKIFDRTSWQTNGWWPRFEIRSGIERLAVPLRMASPALFCGAFSRFGYVHLTMPRSGQIAAGLLLTTKLQHLLMVWPMLQLMPIIDEATGLLQKAPCMTLQTTSGRIFLPEFRPWTIPNSQLFNLMNKLYRP